MPIVEEPAGGYIAEREVRQFLAHLKWAYPWHKLMQKKEQLYEGKAKRVFATDDPALVIVSYKDDATAFDGEKKEAFAIKASSIIA